MHWLQQAPANIALIKYMGKKDFSANIPANSSLSYTLDNLISMVRLTPIAEVNDKWQPLADFNLHRDFSLSPVAQERYIAHLQRLKAYFSYTGSFLIESNNNFPYECGLASSAASFAALTRCGVEALTALTGHDLPSLNEEVKLSRQGSGSSCRSFFSPWALWQGDEVIPLDLPYKKLDHQVIIISNKEKEVSSSLAHERVLSSPLYQLRLNQVEQRLQSLLIALKSKNWPDIFKLCWDDFQEMHQLFASCLKPFSYLTPASTQILNLLTQLWDEEGDGPIVTMDAGPNIHLLYRLEQIDLKDKFRQQYLGEYHVL